VRKRADITQAQRAFTTRLLRSTQRDGINKGIVTLCIGGGQGTALALGRVA
jgi:acetyl-CoA C-acetyltransferase